MAGADGMAAEAEAEAAAVAISLTSAKAKQFHYKNCHHDAHLANAAEAGSQRELRGRKTESERVSNPKGRHNPKELATL